MSEVKCTRGPIPICVTVNLKFTIKIIVLLMVCHKNKWFWSSSHSELFKIKNFLQFTDLSDYNHLVYRTFWNFWLQRNTSTMNEIAVLCGTMSGRQSSLPINYSEVIRIESNVQHINIGYHYTLFNSFVCGIFVLIYTRVKLRVL